MSLSALDSQSLQIVWLSLAGAGGLLAGVLLHFLFSRVTRARLEGEIALRDAQLKSEELRTAERNAALVAASDSLRATFGQVARESLEHNSQSFMHLATKTLELQQQKARTELGEREQAVAALIKPIQAALEQTHRQIGEIEKSRQASFGSISAQLVAMSTGQEQLRTETRKLVSSLRRPEVRGQWGELTLRRLAELAGMVNRCDFSEQVHTTNSEHHSFRPDMIVHLPEKGQLIVDVKTPLDAYLDAVEATDDSVRQAALTRHSRNLQERIKELSSKAYFQQFEHSPEFVILFVPGDQFLTAALDEKPTLLEDALRQKVLLITPTSFVALLKVVAYGWMQLKLAHNAEEIRMLAMEMQNRIAKFTEHLAQVGKRLDDSVRAYNEAIGSLENRVIPSTRKIAELGVGATRDPSAPAAIERTTRELKALPEGLAANLPRSQTADSSSEGGQAT